MSKPKAAALLAMDEAEFLVAIGPMVQSKPWKHILTCDSKGQHLCRKCGQTWPTQAEIRMLIDEPDELEMWVAEEKKIPRKGCPVPDPITDPLPVVVEKLRKELTKEIAENAIPRLLSAAGKICVLCIGSEYRSAHQLFPFIWYGLIATPKQQIVVLLVAMKKVEI